MDRYRGGNSPAPFFFLVIAAASAFSSAAAADAAAPGCVSGALSSECCDVVVALVERGGIACLCRVAVAYPFVYSGYSGDDVLIWYSQGCGGMAKVPDSCIEATADSAPEPAAFSTEHRLF